MKEEVGMDLSTAKLFTTYSDDLKEKIFSTAERYVAIQERTAHPYGYYDHDFQFFILGIEHECCKDLPYPSRNYPHVHLLHARTLKHICHEKGVTEYWPSVHKVARELLRGADRDGVVGQLAALLSKAAIDGTVKKIARCGNARVGKPHSNSLRA